MDVQFVNWNLRCGTDAATSAHERAAVIAQTIAAQVSDSATAHLVVFLQEAWFTDEHDGVQDIRAALEVRLQRELSACGRRSSDSHEMPGEGMGVGIISTGMLERIRFLSLAAPAHPTTTPPSRPHRKEACIASTSLDGRTIELVSAHQHAFWTYYTEATPHGAPPGARMSFTGLDGLLSGTRNPWVLGIDTNLRTDLAPDRRPIAVEEYLHRTFSSGRAQNGQIGTQWTGPSDYDDDQPPVCEIIFGSSKSSADLEWRITTRQRVATNLSDHPLYVAATTFTPARTRQVEPLRRVL
jgi:hypothetical protein